MQLTVSMTFKSSSLLEFCEADSQPAMIEGSIVTLLAIQLGLFGPSTTAGMADVYYKSQHHLCPSMLAPLLPQSDTKVQTCS